MGQNLNPPTKKGLIIFPTQEMVTFLCANKLLCVNKLKVVIATYSSHWDGRAVEIYEETFLCFKVLKEGSVKQKHI